MEIENPPAFPCNSPDGIESYKGMTLRDYFAKGAMQALITTNDTKNENGIDDVLLDPDELATEAGYYADAMLKERTKTK